MSDIIEPVPVQDDFVQGIARIERVGPCARFVLYAEQTLSEAGEIPTRVVVRKIIVPMDALPAAIAQAVEFLDVQTKAPNVVPLIPR